ncbi:SDR family NAD(P)-dependent oxidoreductase [Desulfosporosinus fructosivorans]|uniref:SDR family NAD(P)-dependent oxidoreductase n=1 Tax=Desulfosporosinus fructosivorans TaxID=2018669 RepID=A0A4Z0R010_9FIRM|nr:SDR family NAD(P)-dependent oxidoreductase [Desulfosporosinus fructosivorans]TGE36060.1 SDR family NAD(P)-dependent oxidoreductase [Desulfosporosinus fructosivorans]
MKTSGRTVLITGGGSGIGLAIAERFYKAGNKVIICGRRKEILQDALERLPDLHTIVCDIANEDDRKLLFESIVNEFPELDVLVNNAGIQQRVNLQSVTADWNYYHQEIIANLEAPIHLSLLFLPHLLKKKEGTVINVSSNLGVTPAAWLPIYSSTKAAMHSFTMSLRLQLADTNVNIVEIMPNAINTDLGGVGLHTFGVPVNEFADAVFAGLENGILEIGYAGSEITIRASRDEIDEGAKCKWQNFIKNNPEF